METIGIADRELEFGTTPRLQRMPSLNGEVSEVRAPESLEYSKALELVRSQLQNISSIGTKLLDNVDIKDHPEFWPIIERDDFVQPEILAVCRDLLSEGEMVHEVRQLVHLLMRARAGEFPKDALFDALKEFTDTRTVYVGLDLFPGVEGGYCFDVEAFTNYFEGAFDKAEQNKDQNEIIKLLNLLRWIMHLTVQDFIMGKRGDSDIHEEEYIVKADFEPLIVYIESRLDTYFLKKKLQAIRNIEYDEGENRYDYTRKRGIDSISGGLVGTIAPGIIGRYNSAGELEGFFYATDNNGNPPITSHLDPSVILTFNYPIKTADEGAYELDTSRMRPLKDLEIWVSSQAGKEEEHEAGMRDYLSLLSLDLRPLVERDLGIDLSQFDVRAQNYFLSYIKTASEEDIQKKASLIEQFGRDYLTSFLSLELGGNQMGECIDRICHMYKPEVVLAILDKYAELVGLADGAEDYLQQHYPNEARDKPEAARQVVNSLLQRGNTILYRAAQTSTSYMELLAELEKSQGDIVLFAHAFREVATSIDECRELAVEHIRDGRLSPEDRSQMLQMANQNWDALKALMPDMYAQIMHDVPAQLDGRDPKTGEPIDTTWHILRRGDTVLGFFRLDATAPDTVYFGSMNSLPGLHGFKLGDAILKDMLAKETEGKLTQAHASPKTAICRSYINKYGFVGTGLLPYYDTGETLLAIERDAREGGHPEYQLQGKNFADLSAIRLLGLEKGSEIAEYQFTEDFSDEEYQRFLRECQDRFDRGLVLTAYAADTSQYFTDPASGRTIVRYLAGFEPKAGEQATAAPVAS